MADKYVKLDDVLKIVHNIMTDDKIIHKHRALNRNLKQLNYYNGFVFPPKENLWTIPADPEPYIHPFVTDESSIPDCCKRCSNHPSNGGSGICNCVLPYVTATNPVTGGSWNWA